MATLTNSIQPARGHSEEAVVIPQLDLHLSYQTLTNLISSFQHSLASYGIGQGDAVTISLPNTLEFIVAFLGVAGQRAIAAPINPNYKQEECEFYIGDLVSKLVIVPKGAYAANTAPVRAAKKFGAAIAEVEWTPARGEVVLKVKSKGKLVRSASADALRAQPEDIALVLHTSGTTGRPKAVPLTHGNLTRTMRMAIYSKLHTF